MPPESFKGTYFVTSIVSERRRLFRTHATATLFIETLQHYRALGHYKLHAFVVMPDHVHLLITPSETTTIERAVGMIKGGFSHRLGLKSKFPFWQKGFTERRMRDVDEFIARKKYIHENPVRGHLVVAPEDYPFSSAFQPRTPAAKAAE